MRISAIALAALICAASEATACDMDSPTATLPGFTDAQAQERANKLISDWATIRHYLRTKALIEEATTIYLGRITNAESDRNTYRFSVLIEALRSIKGDMPAHIKKLEGGLPSSCDDPNGDGDGVYTRKNDLVIVFEGVSKHAQRPRGIDSVRVTEVRNLELLDEVQAWLDSLPGYRRHD